MTGPLFVTERSGQVRRQSGETVSETLCGSWGWRLIVRILNEEEAREIKKDLSLFSLPPSSPFLPASLPPSLSIRAAGPSLHFLHLISIMVLPHPKESYWLTQQTCWVQRWPVRAVLTVRNHLASLSPTSVCSSLSSRRTADYRLRERECDRAF